MASAVPVGDTLASCVVASFIVPVKVNGLRIVPVKTCGLQSLRRICAGAARSSPKCFSATFVFSSCYDYVFLQQSFLVMIAHINLGSLVLSQCT